MTTAFPTGLDAFTNPAASAALSTDHTSQHGDLNDAVEALEAKVGIDNSAVPSSLDYRVTVLEGQVAVVAAYNLYKDGANYKYTANGTGSIIIQDGLTVTIYSAPAGNADDIAVLTSMCEWTLTTGAMVAGDATLDSLNGLTIPSSPGTLATQAYAEALVVGLLDDRGNYNASGNTFPASGGSGTAGAVMKGDIWYISVGGTLGGATVAPGDSVRALVDAPGQTAGNWSVLEGNLGFVPASTSASLAQFAATTSLELKTLLTDETGSGSAVFATSPALVTPTIDGLTAGMGTSSVVGNTAFGYHAINAVMTGGQSTCVGYEAGMSLTSSFSNTAFGYGALRLCTNTGANTAIGRFALTAVTGANNTAVGGDNLKNATTGYGNAGVGYNTLAAVNTGFYNTALGQTAGTVVTTGSYNVYLGSNTAASGTAVVNEIALGAQVTGKGSNTATYGTTAITDHYFNGGNVIVSKASGVGTKVDPAAPTFPWADIVGRYTVDTGGVGAPALLAFRGGSVRQYAFDTADVMEIGFHIPHDYAPGTNIYLHVHWAHNGTAISGSLVIDMAHTYAKGHNQQVFPAEKTVTLTVSTPDIATIPQYSHRIDEVQLSTSGGSATLMDTAQLEPDGVVLVHMSVTTKPTITGGTTNHVFIPFVDIHYQTVGVSTKQKAPNFYV